MDRIVFALLLLAACGPSGGGAGEADFSQRPIRAVATTSMLADLVQTIGGEQVDVIGLMGPGIDPHLYRASEGDVRRMAEADVIFYNGLHLEGKMTEVFAQMRSRGIRTVAVAEDAVPNERLIDSPTFAGNFDPHIWFDVALWMDAARQVGASLAEMDPAHGEEFAAHLEEYLGTLQELDEHVRERIAVLPDSQRVLITSHDAFGYFGRAYGFEVHGLQGISTAAEAGTADVQALASFVAERRVPALFIESSVSPRGIEAVRAAVRSRGFEVKIGGTLFGDALGNSGTPEGTYVGMVRHNVETIVEGLSEFGF